MKKHGFTLSELLIAMLIIAIASVLAAPVISNIMPDKNKTRVIKYYTAVKEATSNLLESEAIYYARPDLDSNGMPILKCGSDTVTHVSLACTQQPQVSPYNSSDYEGINKYPNLIRHTLLGDKAATSMPDGSVWTISAVDSSDITKGYTVSIDMEPNNSVNHAYDSSHKKPDTFIFKVSVDGDLTPGDALTEVYIKNTDRTSKKEDMQEAETVTTEF